jgi:DNA polymerase-3 subunit beta
MKKDLALLKKFVCSKKHSPWVDTIQFSGGKIIAWDTDNSLSIDTDIEGEGVYSFGEISKLLAKYPNADVTISGSSLIATVGAKRFTFEATYSNDDYPRLPQQDWVDVGAITITKEFLGLKDFICKDELRPALRGVFFDGERSKITATDAHKMKWIEGVKCESFISNASVFNIPEGLYRMALSNEYVKFSGGGKDFVLRKIDARYPDYTAVIPKDFTASLTVNKAHLVELVGDARMMTNSTTNLIVIDTEKMEMSSKDVDMGRSFNGKIGAIDSEYTIRIGVNAALLEVLLKNIADDVIRFDFSGPNRAIIVNETSLVMPVGLNNY